MNGSDVEVAAEACETTTGSSCEWGTMATTSLYTSLETEKTVLAAGATVVGCSPH